MKRAIKALGCSGIEANCLFSNGGLDANWLDKHGIPTITIGAGQAEIHTIKEYVNLAEYEKGCRLGVLMATMEDIALPNRLRRGSVTAISNAGIARAVAVSRCADGTAEPSGRDSGPGLGRMRS